MSDELAPQPEPGPDLRYVRYPIMIGTHSVALLTVFSGEDPHWMRDMWAMDYLDHWADIRKAADILMEALSPHASVSFMWELRRAIADEIVRHNEKFGTSFPADRLPSEVK